MADRPKPAHYRGSYETRARAIRRAAHMNPNTRCWRCGRTLAEHPPTRTGKPPTWTAGHILDSNPNSPLAAEANVCNYAAGADLRNKGPVNTTRTW